jgi:hypothetical protein
VIKRKERARVSWRLIRWQKKTRQTLSEEKWREGKTSCTSSILQLYITSVIFEKLSV